MKSTFKQYLIEIEIKKQIAIVARDLLGTLNYTTSKNIDDALLNTARQEKHKLIDTAFGPWVISAFKTATQRFVQVVPPRGLDDIDPIYLFPKEYK